jgi:hypothetical protein
VRGDRNKAEDSFIRINQQAATITPQELELLTSRRKPNAIAARAIFRKGTGHKYWSSFDLDTQTEIEALAGDAHRLLFEPTANYPLTTIDLPAGGQVYSSTALRMVYDFINLCVGTPSTDDDEDGQATIKYLKLARRALRLIVSNDPSSLGLHPAVYFYSWTGKQQAILFLLISEMALDYRRRNKLDEFTNRRARLEEFLVGHRSLISQIIRKYGIKPSSMRRLRDYHEHVLEAVSDGLENPAIVEQLRDKYPFLQPEEEPHRGTSGKEFSRTVRSGVAMQNLLASAPRCAICNGFLPTQGTSIDHIDRRESGGRSGADNAQLTHPYCNTGYKEGQLARAGGDG